MLSLWIPRSQIARKIAIFVALILAAVTVGHIVSLTQSAPVLYVASTTPQNLTVMPALVIDGLTIPVEVAATREMIDVGLSGRSLLSARQGMYFIMDRPMRYRFWMKDMQFPLDMIWIEKGKVVDIMENVANDYETEGPKFYRPVVPARSVLEVNAGFVASHALMVGDKVEFLGDAAR